MNGRIWFEGNPWPDGHALAEFTFAACLHEGGAGLVLHLKTRDYFDEYPAPDDEEFEDSEFLTGEDEDPEAASGWLSKIVWGNYHSAILSNLYWGIDCGLLPSFRVAADGRGGALAQSRAYNVDPLLPEPAGGFDPDLNSFQTYLLGHDTTRDHSIVMERRNGVWDIDWSGSISHCYVGETDYRHRFHARIEGARFDGFMIKNPKPPPPWVGSPNLRLSGHSWKPTPPDPSVREARAHLLAERHLGGSNGLRFECGRGFDPDWLRLAQTG